MTNFGLAILLPTLAGLSTSIGSLLSLVFKTPGNKFMSFTLGFSAGLMLLVSFVELLAKGIEAAGFLCANVAFFAGMGVMFLIDVLIPHSFVGEECDALHPGSDQKRLLRTGMFVALGLGIHNFPEGMATFVGTLSNPHLGYSLAAAIAIHNIPEGIAVAACMYAATGSRAKAFWWSTLSGVAEPVGALLAAAVLFPILNEFVLSIVLASVAGIMVYIALDELLPASRKFGHEHLSIFGAMLGMLVMAASLQLLR